MAGVIYFALAICLLLQRLKHQRSTQKVKQQVGKSTEKGQKWNRRSIRSRGVERPICGCSEGMSRDGTKCRYTINTSRAGRAKVTEAAAAAAAAVAAAAATHPAPSDGWNRSHSLHARVVIGCGASVAASRSCRLRRLWRPGARTRRPEQPGRMVRPEVRAGAVVPGAAEARSACESAAGLAGPAGAAVVAVAVAVVVVVARAAAGGPGGADASALSGRARLMDRCSDPRQESTTASRRTGRLAAVETRAASCDAAAPASAAVAEAAMAAVETADSAAAVAAVAAVVAADTAGWRRCIPRGHRRCGRKGATF
jgi:hypothetical protein